LVIGLVLFLIGALPHWPHSANWGYDPSGGAGTVSIVLLMLFVVGWIETPSSKPIGNCLTL
jgi:hypothetical protein